MGSELDTFLRAVRQVIQDEYPELSTRVWYPVKGRVAKVHPDGRVDLQILDIDGVDDNSIPLIPFVHVPESLGALSIGAMVRVGFYYADPGQPYIEALA